MDRGGRLELQGSSFRLLSDGFARHLVSTHIHVAYSALIVASADVQMLFSILNHHSHTCMSLQCSSAMVLFSAHSPISDMTSGSYSDRLGDDIV
jgi:hypothetical protein